MNRRPSQYARPRLATMPKFLKNPLFRGLYCQSTLPVAPSSAKTLSSFVVTNSLPPMASGYDCWPRRTSGSSFWKSTTYARSRRETFAGAIWVSGECRSLAAVRPKDVQSPSTGAVPPGAALATDASVAVVSKATAANRARSFTRLDPSRA